MVARDLVVLYTALLLCLAAVHGAMPDFVTCPTTGTYQNLLNTDASGRGTIGQVSAEYRAGMVRPRT
jgi:hypothetical protein